MSVIETDGTSDLWVKVAGPIAEVPHHGIANLRASAEFFVPKQFAGWPYDVRWARRTIANYMWFEGASRNHVHVALRAALANSIATRTIQLDDEDRTFLAELRRNITRDLSIQISLADFLITGRRLISTILALDRNPFTDFNLSIWFRILDEHLLNGHADVSHALQADISVNRIKLLTAIIENEPSVGQTYLGRLTGLCGTGDWDFAI